MSAFISRCKDSYSINTAVGISLTAYLLVDAVIKFIIVLG